jgi:hypothetical protein
MGRAMPAAVEDSAVQCTAGCEEQGGGEVVWEVLVVLCVDRVQTRTKHLAALAE